MRFILAWALLFAATAAAVDVEPIQKRDTPIVISHDAGETVNAVFVGSDGEWRFLGDEHFRRGDTETVMAAPAGRYLISTGDSTIVQVIEEGKPEPGPSPDPQPQPEPEPPEPEPEPGPQPILAKWVVFVEEQSERAEHPEQTAVMMSPTFRQSMSDKGIRVRVYDDDQEAGKPFASIAGELPAMILVESPTVFRSFPVPTTVDSAEQIIRENVVR